MKKVLIISYYWPPSGGPGVQRVLKFVKYLPEFGWQPIVLTVRNGAYPAIDNSLKKEIPENCGVYKTPAFEPNIAYKKFIGMKEEERIPVSVLAEKQPGFKKRIAHWIRLNLFIPDAKRGWLPFAINQGKAIIKHEKPDLIFSSSPPPTVHLIAQKLAKKYGLKWVADFRDPWTDIHYYEDQPRLPIVKYIDKQYELNILRSADRITCISKLDIEADFSKKISTDKCLNIPNGYDESDFENLSIPKLKSDKFVIMHVGAVGSERDPVNLFKAVRELANESKINPANFEITFIGKVESSVINTINKFKINDYINFISYLPHHDAIAQSMNADLMLLLVTQSAKNTRILPGKTFEYLRTGKPVMALGPVDGEVARIIKETETGTALEYSDQQGIKEFIKQQFDSLKDGSQKYIFAREKIINYERKNLTGKLAETFKAVIQEKDEKH